MLTYWDMDEKERAALSAEDVERFIDAELMSKGVLRVRTPNLVPEPALPEPDVTVYVAESASYGRMVAFPSMEAFEAARAGGMLCLESSYLGGTSYYYAQPFERDAVVKRVYSAAAFHEHKRALDAYASAKKANEDARAKYVAEIKAQDEALRGLWDDWHACRGKDAEMRRIEGVFADYVRTAGDKATAAKFLLKVFSAEQIRDAAEWCGLDIPTDLPAAAE